MYNIYTQHYLYTISLWTIVVALFIYNMYTIKSNNDSDNNNDNINNNNNNNDSSNNTILLIIIIIKTNSTPCIITSI